MGNKITIEGNLGKDPELKYVGANGMAVCELSVGATPRKQDRNGNWADRGAAQWYRLTAFEAEAEAWADAFNKGDRVVASGTLVVEEFTRQDGTFGYALTLVNATVGMVPRAQKQPQNAAYGANTGSRVPQHGQASFNPPQDDPWASRPNNNPPF